MSRFLYRLGHGSAAHPWRTIAAWVLVAASVVGALLPRSAARPRTTTTSPTPAPRSASTSSVSTCPSPASASAQVVVHDESGTQPGQASSPP